MDTEEKPRTVYPFKSSRILWRCIVSVHSVPIELTEQSSHNGVYLQGVEIFVI